MWTRIEKPILLWALCAASFMAVTLSLRSYPSAIMEFGDSGSYMNVAKAIGSWHFAGLQVLQFWGVSYVLALVAIATHAPLLAALVAVSAGSSAAVTLLANRLWGWHVAALVTALNFDWMQRSLLGGSEPLFMLLLLGAFLAVRHERWWLASLMASLATTVRPLGICALVAIGLVLLYRRQYGRFAAAFATGVLVGSLYVLPLQLYMHDPLATVHSYETSRPLFGIPFVAILEGTFHEHPPLTNLLLSYFWIVLVVGGILLLSLTRACSRYRRDYPVEFLFALFYTFMVCCYNYPHWALGNFARFSIPAIPFALVGWRDALTPHVPTLAAKARTSAGPAIWASALVFPALAACSAYGIRNLIR